MLAPRYLQYWGSSVAAWMHLFFSASNEIGNICIVEILSKWWFRFYAEKYRLTDIFTDLINILFLLFTDGLCVLLTIQAMTIE
jgi:hypothetical protein